MDNRKINDKLVNFWNEALLLSSEEKEQIRKEEGLSLKDLAPSQKLFDAASSLGKCHKVLDFGCGNGWGAIIAYKSGCQDVEAVDLGDNIIDSAKFYASLFDAKINAYTISPDWLKNTAKSQYSGVICSNVLDVVPLETAKEIIQELARVTLPNAQIIIGLNYYFPLDKAKERGMDVREDKYLFMDDILRLLSLKDDEWKELFTLYFEIEKLEYFAWPNEEQERRRLFYLRKK